MITASCGPPPNCAPTVAVVSLYHRPMVAALTQGHPPMGSPTVATASPCPSPMGAPQPKGPP